MAIAHEPIFSRQEQGVIYLFSRHWHEIDVFRNKEISRIHTHFPDFSIKDIKTGAEEAIEFEYSLHDFRSHLGNLGNLNDSNIRLLYIVYWDHNDDEAELRKSIIGRRRRNDFTGKVVLVCLKDFFSAAVKPGPDYLLPSWMFPANHVAKAYPFTAIDKAVAALESQGLIRWFKPHNRLYRTSGFNKIGSAYIECSHWQKIHFYTTSAMATDKIPSKLLLKPTGCDYFAGYFKIQYAFFIKEGSRHRLLKEFFKKYYFYRYLDEYGGSTCFVYSDFEEISHEQGRKLYQFLKKRIRLDIRGSKLIDHADIDKIDKILEGQHHE